MNRIKSLSQKGNICLLFYIHVYIYVCLFVCMYTHTHTHTRARAHIQVYHFFILQVTETATYQLVSEGYVTVY